MDKRSLAGYSSWGHKESDTTEWLILTRKKWEEDAIGTQERPLFQGGDGGGSSFTHSIPIRHLTFIKVVGNLRYWNEMQLFHGIKSKMNGVVSLPSLWNTDIHTQTDLHTIVITLCSCNFLSSKKVCVHVCVFSWKSKTFLEQRCLANSWSNAI